MIFRVATADDRISRLKHDSIAVLKKYLPGFCIQPEQLVIRMRIEAHGHVEVAIHYQIGPVLVDDVELGFLESDARLFFVEGRVEDTESEKLTG